MGEEYRRQQLILGMTPAYGGLICYDNFDEALTWDAAGTSGGNKISLVDYKPYRGGSCLEIYNDLETPIDNQTIGARRYFMLAEAELLRTKFMFKVEEKDNIAFLTFNNFWQTNTRITYPNIRYDIANNKVQYWDSGSTWQDVPGGAYIVQELAWLYFELVCNVKKSEYVSINLNGREIDLSGIATKTADGSYGEQGYLQLQAEQEGTAGRAKIWIDEFLILSE